MFNIKPSVGLKFKNIELSDNEWVTEICDIENSRSADYNFVNIFIWDKKYDQLIAKAENRLIVQPRYGREPFYAFPIGSGDLKPVIYELRAYALEHGFPFVMRGVTDNHKEELDSLFPGKFEFMDDRDNSDYIYRAEALAEMRGKKLHSKRNHINRFIEANDWTFERLGPETIPECLSMLDDWTEEKAEGLDMTLQSEHVAIERAVQNFEALGIEGGILRSSGKIVAFTLGEKISEDTFVVNFEKAYADIQGSYPMVCREFARQIITDHPEIAYLNREDDMGLENLRKSKLSYDPEFILQKYTAIWRE